MTDFDKRVISGISTFFAVAFIGLCLVFCIMFTYGPDAQRKVDEELAIKNNAIEQMTRVKCEIVCAIDNYLLDIAPTNKIDSNILFELCEQYGVDVRFALAQGQVESHFATKGTAKKTNSIFNVGAYDGHSAKRQMRNGFGYADPNDSIEPYLILITNNYLVDGKTIHDLMLNYVNNLGMRYASDRRYEKMLRNVYNRINTSTNLDILIAEYNEYKAIIG